MDQDSIDDDRHNIKYNLESNGYCKYKVAKKFSVAKATT